MKELNNKRFILTVFAAILMMLPMSAMAMLMTSSKVENNDDNISIGNEISVNTSVFDGNGQPPIVIGKIDNYSDKITKKGFAVGLNPDDLFISSDTEYSGVWQQRVLENGNLEREFPVSTRFYDCTSFNKDQFCIPLRLLVGEKKYYVKAFAIDNDNNIYYGNIVEINTQAFNRYSRGHDQANAFYSNSSSYTLFDLKTDEIINPSEGFYYSSNENPTTVRFKTIETGSNICYKFSTEWNYKLWYYHSLHCNRDLIVGIPSMYCNNGKVFITKNSSDSDKDISIYYSIDGDFLHPETFTEVYTEPISVPEGHHVCCYAISSEGYISFTNMIISDNSSSSIETINITDSKRTDRIYNTKGQHINAPQKGINIINGKKILLRQNGILNKSNY